MSSRRSTVIPAVLGLLLGTLAVTAAQARGPEVQWQVVIGAPVLPAPTVVVPVPPHHGPYPVYRHHPPRYPVHYHPYREPTHWDVDGDGIPNRYDRFYNPVWDRNGNGLPDRREFRHHPYGDRDRDGVPNRYDRQDDRRDGGWYPR
jgi:hypothetical protein